jgi:hypothetical protein
LSITAKNCQLDNSAPDHFGINDCISEAVGFHFLSMKSDKLKEFVKLQTSLHTERSIISRRLDEINEALGSIQPPSLSAANVSYTDNTAAGRKTRRGPRRQLSAEAKARIAAAARKRWAKAKASGRNRL